MNLTLDPADLRPLVQSIVAETIAALQQHAGILDGDRLAFPEPEAASKLGVAPHVLRDARLRGEITPTKVGGRYSYEKTELISYLARQRGATK